MGAPIRMPLPKRFTVQEYLLIERKAGAKSEFHQGQILAMVGHRSIIPLLRASFWQLGRNWQRKVAASSVATRGSP